MKVVYMLKADECLSNTLKRYPYENYVAGRRIHACVL
jgi:hypothetical protein